MSYEINWDISDTDAWLKFLVDVQSNHSGDTNWNDIRKFLKEECAADFITWQSTDSPHRWILPIKFENEETKVEFILRYL